MVTEKEGMIIFLFFVLDLNDQKMTSFTSIFHYGTHKTLEIKYITVISLTLVGGKDVIK